LVVPSDVALVPALIEKAIQHKLSVWDAVVVEAAILS
jgi:predicted nucleic acid-binding protein